MLGYLKKKLLKNELEQLDNRLEKSFNNINGDIQKINSWIGHLHSKNTELEHSHREEVLLKKNDLNQLTNWVGFLHKHNNDVQKQVQSLQNYTITLNERVSGMEARMAEVLDKLGSVGSVRTEPEPGSEPKLNLPDRTGFEERMLIKHIRPNRRNYVIKAILDAIRGEELTTKQLESLIVREKQLCGRTTFYTHLKELKNKGALDIAELGAKSILMVKE